jgi:hypothetical protein
MASFPDPAKAKSLADARQQAHHAAQLATAAGISFLPKTADDSHTNLEWLPSLGALASRVVPSTSPFRIAVRIASLEVCLLDNTSTMAASLPLDGCKIADAEAWLRKRIAERGADAAQFTLKKHYEIPHHAVDDGRAFDASDRVAFAELAAWYDVAVRSLEGVRVKNAGSEIRCWPHHFDIATLIEIGPGKSIGVGMEPGDNYYDEPYFYVNAYPSPKATAVMAPLAGSGEWHTHEWVGAVLPGSRVGPMQSGESQIAEFLDSAIAGCRQLLA